MPFEEQQVTEISRIAPDVVVDVRSPDDRQADIDEKVRVYLAAGTNVIFLVDPDAKTVTVKDATGTRVTGEDGLVAHDSLHGFNLRARLLFEAPRPRTR